LTLGKKKKENKFEGKKGFKGEGLGKIVGMGILWLQKSTSGSLKKSTKEDSS